MVDQEDAPGSQAHDGGGEQAPLTKPGAEPAEHQLAVQARLESTGGLPRDSVLLARLPGIAIWQTEKTATNDPPQWHPPFGQPKISYRFRGFAIKNLGTVLATGLDVPAHSAFFAAKGLHHGWEWPHQRDIAAVLILEKSSLERSHRSYPEAGPPEPVDKTKYPNEYRDGGRVVHTRFELDANRGTRTYFDEQLYGYWVPGDARDALLAVVLGGPQADIVELLNQHAPRGLQFVH